MLQLESKSDNLSYEIDLEELKGNWKKCAIHAESIAADATQKLEISSTGQESLTYVLNEIIENIYAYACPDKKLPNISLRINPLIHNGKKQLAVVFTNLTDKHNLDRVSNIFQRITDSTYREKLKYESHQSHSLGLFNIVNQYHGILFFLALPFRNNLYKLDTKILIDV